MFLRRVHLVADTKDLVLFVVLDAIQKGDVAHLVLGEMALHVVAVRM